MPAVAASAAAPRLRPAPQATAKQPQGYNRPESQAVEFLPASDPHETDFVPTVSESADSPAYYPEPIESTDQLRAQLDLANAYINMGDKAEARDLLIKLVDCDNVAIREEAQDILTKL